ASSCRSCEMLEALFIGATISNCNRPAAVQASTRAKDCYLRAAEVCLQTHGIRLRDSLPAG
ncbi:Unknown protein, partial [Striga hermonthica]